MNDAELNKILKQYSTDVQRGQAETGLGVAKTAIQAHYAKQADKTPSFNWGAWQPIFVNGVVPSEFRAAIANYYAKQSPAEPQHITCQSCGRQNVPDWDGQGHCISCARDSVELEQIIADICCTSSSDGERICRSGKLCTDCVKDKQRLIAWADKRTKRAPAQANGDDLKVALHQMTSSDTHRGVLLAYEDEIRQLIKIYTASPNTSKVTRFELIDHRPPPQGVGISEPVVGRVIVETDIRVVLSYQDDGRTLKCFITNRNGDN